MSSVCLSVCLSVKRMCCDTTKAPSEKSSITIFPMSLRWTAYVAANPKMGSQKRFFSIFRIKNGLFSKKVCYKVSLCENFERQSCKAFTGLSIRAYLFRDPTSRLQQDTNATRNHYCLHSWQKPHCCPTAHCVWQTGAPTFRALRPMRCSVIGMSCRCKVHHLCLPFLFHIRATNTNIENTINT